MLVVGVDVGFSGAITVVNEEREIISVNDMPTLNTGRTELNETAIRDIFLNTNHIFIERAQTMPKQGISSSGRYMMSYGILRGICVGLGIPYTLVLPQAWKKSMMVGMPKEKEASIVRANQLYPSLPLPSKSDHGKADSILIALYGLQLLKTS